MDDELQPKPHDERKFRLAIERSSDAIFITTPDGVITFVNPAFEALYGYTAAEAIGRTPRLLKSGAQDTAFYERMWSNLLAKEIVPVEVINQTKDGGLVHVESTANPILDDSGALLGFVAIQRDITERRRVEQRLRESEEALRESEIQYRELFDNSPIPTWVFDTQTMQFLAVNDTAVAHYGYTRDEFLRMRATDIRSPEEATRLTAVARDARPGVVAYGIWKHRKKDGTALDANITGQTLEIQGRRCMIVYAQDVTDQKRLEEQYRHAQKMEAVGRLAGGVAHDFNNMLSVILGYAAMLTADLPEGSRVRDDVEEIERAGRRAAELTAQLLAFSRRQVLEPQVLDLNVALQKMERMIGRLIGEDIELLIVGDPALWMVKVDPGQIEQIVMNLAVNARDAMPDGGKLTIETRNVPPNEEAGSHVMLTVADTGVGMDEATQSQIFEPFYTTKEVGKGTGLGLSTVLGIVEQSGGTIRVRSEVGRGATFELLFPRSEDDVVAMRRPSVAPMDHAGETILLVEDETQVRRVMIEILGRHHYNVLVASGPVEALALAENHAGKIHLLVTDLLMPGMDGRRMAERVLVVRPDTRVLYVSGYFANLAAIAQEGFAFLQKPITHATLLAKVRAVLDEPR